MSEITPEKVEALRLSLEAEHARGLGGIVDSETVLAIIGAYPRLMGMALELSDKPSQAVVVEGETDPIVLERPSLEQDWTNPPNDVRSWVSPDYFVCVQTWRTDVAYLTPEQARREAARLAALADEAQKLAGEEIAKRRAEAAQAEKGGTDDA